jgi:tRNA(fMet)-specific endonuclease VapC
LGYTKRDARVSAEIEVSVERRGGDIRRTDAMIASVAMNNGASLYTFDLKHFKPLEEMGLQLFQPSIA